MNYTGYQQPYYQQPVYQPQMVQQTQPQIQNGGLVIVRDEREILNYPVAPGNVVTFRVENKPLIVEKTQGFSQFEPPRYQRWRVERDTEEYVSEVREDPSANPDSPTPAEGIEDLKKSLEDIKKRVSKLERRSKTDKSEDEES